MPRCGVVVVASTPEKILQTNGSCSVNNYPQFSPHTLVPNPLGAGGGGGKRRGESGRWEVL